MTYQEKKVWVSLVACFLLLIMYAVYFVNKIKVKGQAIFEDGAYWARTLLIVLGIFIVCMVVIQIIAHILMAITVETKKVIYSNAREKEDVMEIDDYFEEEDEMDRLIDWKAGTVSQWVMGIGFVLSLVILACNISIGIVLNVCFCSFIVSTFAENIVQLRLYKRGVYHG